MEDGNCLSHKDSGQNYDLFGRFSFVITPEQKVTPHCMLWLVFLLPDGTSNRLWLNLTPPQSLNTTKVTGQNLQVLLDGLWYCLSNDRIHPNTQIVLFLIHCQHNGIGVTAAVVLMRNRPQGNGLEIGNRRLGILLVDFWRTTKNKLFHICQGFFSSVVVLGTEERRCGQQ